VVEAFLAVEGEFYQAALRYCDSDEESSVLVA
jgi:hypothetical protein